MIYYRTRRFLLTRVDRLYKRGEIYIFTSVQVLYLKESLPSERKQETQPLSTASFVLISPVLVTVRRHRSYCSSVGKWI